MQHGQTMTPADVGGAGKSPVAARLVVPHARAAIHAAEFS